MKLPLTSSPLSKADDTATRADPETLWGDLAEKDAKIEQLETIIAELRGDIETLKGNGGTGLRLPSQDDRDSDAADLKRRIEKLEQSAKGKQCQ